LFLGDIGVCFLVIVVNAEDTASDKLVEEEEGEGVSRRRKKERLVE
jgi:hypothetical protein